MMGIPTLHETLNEISFSTLSTTSTSIVYLNGYNTHITDVNESSHSEVRARKHEMQQLQTMQDFKSKSRTRRRDNWVNAPSYTNFYAEIMKGLLVNRRI